MTGINAFGARWKPSWLFILTVFLPSVLGILYFGLIAPSVYVSESSFIVQSSQQQSGFSLGNLLKGSGLSRSADDTYAVQDFVMSRDAVTDLGRAMDLRAVLFRGLRLPWERLPVVGYDQTDEDLYKLYKTHVDVEMDTTSSIAVLTTRAYTAEDSFRINEVLLQEGEQLVNRMNERAKQNTIAVAEAEVKKAEARAIEAALALAQYRDRASVMDPEKQSALLLQEATKLREQLYSDQATLSALQMTAGNNPQVPILKMRIKEIEDHIRAANEQVTSGSESFAGKAVAYQRLALEREFSDKMLASTMATLEQARDEAARQQLWLERISQPSRPDKATEPRRVRDILAIFVLGLVAWGVGSMLVAGIKEHQD
jgi:capsular polysaccharide transport system permease protein